MNIKKVSDKPMVIHTQNQSRIRLHNGQKTVIRKKVTPDSVTVKRKNEKNRIWQRIEESGQSIKVHNQSLRTMTVAGARMGAGQVEGGEELKESIDLMVTFSSPAFMAAKNGEKLYRKKRAGKQRQHSKGKKALIEKEYVDSSVHTRKQAVKEKRGKSNIDSKESSKRKESHGLGVNGAVKGRMIDTFLEKFQSEQEEQKDFITSTKETVKATALLLIKQAVVFVTPFFLGAFALISIVGIIVVAILAVIYNSPVSIFFPLPDTGYDNPRTVLCEYYKEFNQKITSLEEQGYVITYQNSEDGVPVSNFNDTLMVYMVKYGTGQPAYVMDDEGKKHLKEIFQEMNYYDSSSSTVKISAGEPLGDVVATGYCSCSICCGSYSNGITASGKKAKPKHTIAVDAYNPIVPMGTKVVMNGITYTVEDTGNLNANGVDFDIYFATHQEALNWGKRTIKVYLADGNENEVEIVTTNTQVHNLSYKDYIALNKLTTEQVEWLESMMSDEMWDSYYVGAGGQAVADLAMTKIGCKYSQDKRYEEGYYDCSSLVQRLYREIGIDLPATAAAQGKYCYDNAMIINKKELKPGDLIFYSYEENGEFRNISHVAIYVGNGKMVHAANPGRGVVLDELRTNRVVFYGRPY